MLGVFFTKVPFLLIPEPAKSAGYLSSLPGCYSSCCECLASGDFSLGSPAYTAGASPVPSSTSLTVTLHGKYSCHNTLNVKILDLKSFNNGKSPQVNLCKPF